ncbi:hypothetical protein [Prosthecomicrobium pneumaticum]|uniref:Uncharacterized protein n=1 Tax=Prosthecomicrobium pneumaticum TaxID=81895 RepID=A0A7W9CSN4_9HYPH|nr:hypothetical protein [Prosthecomicrobium pneumaticum]MBB5751072.1 hypothetical protein [Prosthecomicrobium pneumaticum]
MVPQRFRDFDVYAIVDDDLLVSGKAPPLPAIPEGEIGLARDAVQTNTHNAAVEWTGNTGFVVVGPNGADLLLEAYETGDDPSVWGIADQGALNAVAWRRKRVHEIDQRWNFAPILTYFVSGRGWHTWSTSRRYRASYYLKVAANPFSQERRLLEASWGCHLIRTKTPTFFDRFLP